MAIAIGGRNTLHIGSDRRCLAPLVCARMDTDLSGVSHTEEDFDRPEWVPAMRDVVAESSPEHVVKMRTLEMMSICEFVDQCDEPCTGSWRVVRPQDD